MSRASTTTYQASGRSCTPPWPQDLHRQVHMPSLSSHAAPTSKSTSTSAPTLFTNIVLAPTRRSYSTDMSFSDEANHFLPGTDEAKASHHVRHRRGGHHQARYRRGEAAHLSELTRPDIFIIGHRQAGGIRLSIAGATDVPLRLPFIITSSSSTPRTWRRRDLKTTTIAAA